MKQTKKNVGNSILLSIYCLSITYFLFEPQISIVLTLYEPQPKEQIVSYRQFVPLYFHDYRPFLYAYDYYYHSLGLYMNQNINQVKVSLSAYEYQYSISKNSLSKLRGGVLKKILAFLILKLIIKTAEDFEPSVTSRVLPPPHRHRNVQAHLWNFQLYNKLYKEQELRRRTLLFSSTDKNENELAKFTQADKFVRKDGKVSLKEMYKEV